MNATGDGPMVNKKNLTTSQSVSHTSQKDDRPCIVAILPRGEAIRNFVYSGALDKVAQFAKVIIFSVIPSEEIRALLENRYEMVIELAEIHERWIVRFTREILDIAHGRYLWSEAAKERWRRRDWEANTIPKKIKRWVKKVLCYPFAHPKGLEVLSNLECYLSYRLRTTNQYVDLLRELNPSLVFNGSHVHGSIALPILHAARALGIPTVAFIFSWDNLTSQGRIIPPYDYYLVWNEHLREQLLTIYPSIRPDQVFVTGTPQFDFHFRPEFWWTKEEFCTRVGADPNRPIVFYSTGMANHMPGEPYIVEGIADMLQKMTDLGPPQLLVRVYPKDRTKRFEELKRRRPDILFPEIPWEPAWLTPKLEDCYLLTNMLRYADVGINIASTISLELCMFDKPVINVGYNPPGIDISPVDYRKYYEFDHYRPVVQSGAVMVARSPEDMERMIRRALYEPQADSEKRQRFIKAMFGDTLDGRSGERVAMKLLELADRARTLPTRSVII